MSERIPDTRCPACGHDIDEVQAVDSGEPRLESGDWTVCFYCASVGIVDDEGVIQEATAVDLEDAPGTVFEISTAIRDSLDAMVEDKAEREGR